MSNTIDEMIDAVSKHLDRLRTLSPKQIRQVIVEMKKETHIWSKLASGNRDYLESALKADTDKALLGAIPHLAAALPHRLGFIASAEARLDAIGDPIFDEVILGKISLAQLDPKDVVQFLRDFLNSKKIPKHWNMFNQYARTVQTWIDTYDRKHSSNAEQAYAYINEKRNKIVNLFSATIFPQLSGAVAREQA